MTSVDSDRRAARCFGDETEVAESLADHGADPDDRTVRFVGADYRTDLGLREESFDLLVSLYAGFVSEHCTRYLKVGGTHLVNPSHGDAAMASIDSATGWGRSCGRGRVATPWRTGRSRRSSCRSGTSR